MARRNSLRLLLGTMGVAFLWSIILLRRMGSTAMQSGTVVDPNSLHFVDPTPNVTAAPTTPPLPWAPFYEPDKKTKPTDPLPGKPTPTKNKQGRDSMQQCVSLAHSLPSSDHFVVCVRQRSRFMCVG